MSSVLSRLRLLEMSARAAAASMSHLRAISARETIPTILSPSTTGRRLTWPRPMRRAASPTLASGEAVELERKNSYAEQKTKEQVSEEPDSAEQMELEMGG